ncbi:hypothetical protein Taro_043056 [Colocasia esculenta]|uniref:Mitochondrial glycoprotein family protein n=1 Tax=Colocasia esculenta TaxID=4460 RepID=A0A843WUK2_COLES|nr:hypothetical protein [Colocasia esculenta]
MAFSGTLRAASSAGALAARALCGRHSSGRLRPLAKVTRRATSSSSAFIGAGSSDPFFARLFSAQAQKVGLPSDSSILRVLDAEIKYAEESDDHDRKDEIPGQFPFEVEDAPGSTTITLRKVYHGESIKVIVSMPDLVTGDRGVEDAERSEQKSSQSSLPLIANVTKGDGTSLEFGCTAYPDEVCIDSLVVREAGLSDQDLAYEGPDFNDLDENLQKAFHKYLDIRGISPSTTNYLHEYMINKDSREYSLWLKKMKQFIQK